jgi:hypothetical protein
MTIESKSQFAKRISRAPSYITELLSHGRLVLDATGKKIDVEASLAKLAETSSGANPAVAERHAQARKSPAAKKKPRLAKNTDEEPTRASYKSQVLHFENEQIKLEIELRQSKRFDLGDVRREALNLGNTLRASLERLVDQTAPRLSVMQSAAERKQLLKIELLKLKTAVKAEFPRSLRRMQKS